MNQLTKSLKTILIAANLILRTLKVQGFEGGRKRRVILLTWLIGWIDRTFKVQRQESKNQLTKSLKTILIPTNLILRTFKVQDSKEGV